MLYVWSYSSDRHFCGRRAQADYSDDDGLNLQLFMSLLVWLENWRLSQFQTCCVISGSGNKPERVTVWGSVLVERSQLKYKFRWQRGLKHRYRVTLTVFCFDFSMFFKDKFNRSVSDWISDSTSDARWCSGRFSSPSSAFSERCAWASSSCIYTRAKASAASFAPRRFSTAARSFASGDLSSSWVKS